MTVLQVEPRRGSGNNGTVERITDIAALDDALPGLSAQYIQLKPGRFSAEISLFDGVAVSVSSCRCSGSFSFRASPGDDRVFIAYINSAKRVLETSREWPTDYILLSYGHDVHITSLGMSDMTLISVDLSNLSQSVRDFLTASGSSKRLLRMPATNLQKALVELSAGLRHAADAEAALLEEITVLASLGRDAELPPSRERYAALLERAEQFMAENLDEPLSLERVCLNARCRTRRLVYCFKAQFEVGPVRYSKILRLNAVHRRLLRAKGDISIFDAAADFGFWHMGHFGADYKHMFGVTPSQTLAAQP